MKKLYKEGGDLRMNDERTVLFFWAFLWLSLPPVPPNVSLIRQGISRTLVFFSVIIPRTIMEAWKVKCIETFDT